MGRTPRRLQQQHKPFVLNTVWLGCQTCAGSLAARYDLLQSLKLSKWLPPLHSTSHSQSKSSVEQLMSKQL